MANELRTRDGLPFNFVDGLRIKGVDVTNWEKIFIDQGASYVGFQPVGNLAATNVQAAIAELDTKKAALTALADTEGAALVGYDGGNVRTVLDNAKSLQDYTALRAYTGRAASVRILATGIAGFFYWDVNDTVSLDNGGTIIVSSNGRRWKRLFDGAVNVKWFGAKGDAGASDYQPIQNAINSGFKIIYIPSGVYLVNTKLIVPKDVSIYGDGSASIVDGRSITESNAAVMAQSGSVLTTTSLSSDVSVGSNTLPLTSVTGITAGAWILVRSTLDNSWSGTWGAANRKYRKQTIFRVYSVTGNTITLNEETNTTFESASTTVEVLSTTTSNFSDFKIIANKTNLAKGVDIFYGADVSIDRLVVEGGDTFGIGVTSCTGSKITACSVLLDAPAVNTQYGVSVSGCDNTLITSCNIDATRHAVAIVGDQCRRTRVKSCKLRGSYAPDAHGCADQYTYEDCFIEGFYGLKIGGRNGTWRNCVVVSENGTVIGAYEIYGGRFTFDGCSITSYATATADVGWSPIDLGRGTVAISSDSRADCVFQITNSVFNLPNLATYFIRVGNNSPYKVNFDIGNLIINYPGMASLVRYEGTPTASDADYVNIYNITHNATVAPLPYFVQGSGASGYATTTVKLPVYQKNGNYGFGTQVPASKVHIVDPDKGLQINDFGYLYASNASPYITELKTVGTSTSFGQVNITANARYGEIRLRTGWDGSAAPLADRLVVETLGHVRPGADNTQTLGSASYRWGSVYSGTGTINTSDGREKQDIQEITDQEKVVAKKIGKLFKRFRFKDAVQAKGDEARIHVGVIAQEVIAAFESEGLDPMSYGIICYDEWSEELDAGGNTIRPASNRYGIRYEELFAFLMSTLY